MISSTRINHQPLLLAFCLAVLPATLCLAETIPQDAFHALALNGGLEKEPTNIELSAFRKNVKYLGSHYGLPTGETLTKLYDAWLVIRYEERKHITLLQYAEFRMNLIQ